MMHYLSKMDEAELQGTSFQVQKFALGRLSEDPVHRVAIHVSLDPFLAQTL